MSHHPSYTMAAICTTGGILGYAKARSVPSIIAGVGIGAAYAISGYCIKEGKDYGQGGALATSIVLAGSMLPRAIKGGSKPIPWTLSILSIGTGLYYAKKIYEYKHGV
ncbi:6432_t:CDS:2 [Paraglomus occultum]|uniref:6432_t:CDS:1 n=1 Tax=Paraglomus occultum TaxID=144539 RepID=A0A9N9D6D0_9GLOM|nr:6432_t:CDS:2 [Paraglomus occultum]